MTQSLQDQAFHQLAQILAPGSTLLRTWSLKGGISVEMTALEYAHPNGHVSRRVVRQPAAMALARNPQAAAHEFRLLQILCTAELATPKPYLLDQSGTIFPEPYFVTEYIEGAPEFAPIAHSDFTRQFATQLARLHQLDCAAHDISFVPTYPSVCAEILGAQAATPNTALDTGRIRAALQAVGVFPQHNRTALLHGDYWPGNVLWQHNQLMAVIDWEDAKRGDPLIDLAISRLDLLWIVSHEAMQDFTQHYQAQTGIDTTNLPYWDLCAALRLARLAGTNLDEWAAFFLAFGRYDITAQSIRAHNDEIVSQALERLALH